MPGIPLLDQLMANAWRPAVEEQRGDWRYRWADGMSRRANSVLAVGSDGIVPELVDHAEAFYGQRGAPARIQVSTASAPRDLAAYLHGRGYRSTARTLVQEATTQEVVDRTHRPLEVEITEVPTEEWFHTYWSVEAGRSRREADMLMCRDVLLAPGPPD